MSNPIIKVEGLGKKYRIRHKRPEQYTAYTALRDVIAEKALNALRLKQPRMEVPTDVEDFWALRDISFEVRRGEVLGIIGRNGAGKSTLLKVLSRITEPTEGRIEIDGRVASLLEVGTGFHPELTGRENIFLNSAVLGMSRVEIRRKFDAIVAFAEVEKFLDTPVKRYSSGMYVRLAFAIAAHVNSEIIIIDEVLAVGDAEFQRKCFDKIGEVVTGGRTILLVSHQLRTIVTVCARAIVLDSGHIICDALPNLAVSSYLSRSKIAANHILFQRQIHNSGADAEIACVELLDANCRPKINISTFDYVRLRLGIKCFRAVPLASAVIELTNIHGIIVLKLESTPSAIQLLSDCGVISIDCCISEFPLIAGNYLLSIGLAAYGIGTITWHSDVTTLVIASPSNFHQSVDNAGVAAARHHWVRSDFEAGAEITKAMLVSG